MGLDIYFHRTTRKAWEAYNKEVEDYRAKTKEEREKADYPELDCEDCGYFRKTNFLLPFFGYGEDCTYHPVAREEIEELADRCGRVLENHDLGDDLLPTQSGFFFGDTEYDDYYLDDVKYVKEWAEEFLESDTEWESDVVLMYCWW